MTSWARVTVTVVAALATLLLLFPFAGTDGQPQMHYSVFGTRVPTDNPLLAYGASLVVGAVAWTLAGRNRTRS